jgi:hypothetical protein
MCDASADKSRSRGWRKRAIKPGNFLWPPSPNKQEDQSAAECDQPD